MVKELIKAGADVNMQDDIGWTALMCAVENGNENIVRELIDRGAKVNMQDNNGDTALMIAVKWGDENMVKKLIEAGANIYLKNKAKETALDIAREKGYRGGEIARMLENIDKKLYICKLAERGDLSELQNLCKEIKKNQKLFLSGQYLSLKI